MISKTILTLGVLCIIVVTYAAPSGEGGDGNKKKQWMEKMKKCGDGEINVTEAFKGMKECMPQEVSTTEATRRRRSPSDDGENKKKGMGKKGMWDKNMCTVVCKLKKQGILDASGKFDEAGCKEHIDEVYPEKYRADALTNIKECASNSSSTFSMDDNCSGYKQFGRCTFGAHMKTCGIEWPKGKGKKHDEGAEAGKEE